MCLKKRWDTVGNLLQFQGRGSAEDFQAHLRSEKRYPRTRCTAFWVGQQYPVVFRDIPKYISGKAMTAIQLTGLLTRWGSSVFR